MDIYKVEKKNNISISVFAYENDNEYPMCVSKNTFKIHDDLLLTESEGKSCYVLIKDCNRFIYNQTLH